MPPSATLAPSPTPAEPPNAEPLPATGGAADLAGRRHQALGSLVAQGVSSAVTFLRLIFLSRVMTEAEVGVYALGLTIVFFIAAMNERLVSAPYTVFAYRRSPQSARTLLGSSAMLSFGWTLAASLLTALAGGVLYAKSPGDSLAVSLLAASILSPFYTLHEFARAASFTHFKVRSVLAIDISTLVLQALLLFAMWAFDMMSIAGVYLVIALSCVPPLAVWAWAWREHWLLNTASFRQDCREIWDFSRWLVLARTMGQGSRLIIPWLVFALLSEAAAGRLALCLSLTGLAWLFVRGLNTFFRPFIVQAFSQGGAAALSRAVLWTSLTQTLLLLPVLILFIFAGDQVMELIYRKSFPSASMLLVLLTVNTLVTSWAIATATGLLALDRPTSNMWIEGATLLLTLVVSAPLLHFSGIEGAAWAMLAGNLAGAAMAYWMFQRELARIPAEPQEAAA